MRGTSAMSIPVPTIMLITVTLESLTTDALSFTEEGTEVNSEQAVATIDQFSIYRSRFRHQFVGFRRLAVVNVQHFMAVRDQPVGNHHAMTMEVHALGAHVSGAQV